MFNDSSAHAYERAQCRRYHTLAQAKLERLSNTQKDKIPLLGYLDQRYTNGRVPMSTRKSEKNI